MASGASEASPAEAPLGSLLDLSGNVAVVTGAAQGFGFACARRLAEAGAAVVLADRRLDRLDVARERIAAAGRTVEAVEGDIAVEADVERLVATAVSRFGRLDVLVNNAGVFSNFLLEAPDPGRVRPHPRRQRRRHLSLHPGGRGTDAGAGQRRLDRQHHVDRRNPPERLRALPLRDVEARDLGPTKTMALELGPDGIRVNAVAPGPSLTEGAVEFVEAGAPEGIDVDAQWGAYEARIPLQSPRAPRRRRPHDPLSRVDLGAYVNGAQIVVDGGLLAA